MQRNAAPRAVLLPLLAAVLGTEAARAREEVVAVPDASTQAPPVGSQEPSPAASTPDAEAPARALPPAAPARDPESARVSLRASHAGAWLELRDWPTDPWRRVCPAPCDRVLRVEGREARVTAPGMTPSNVFRLEAGAGTARVRVEGGSATARRVGIWLLAAGVPVALGGFAMLGLGGMSDAPPLTTAGAITLGAGSLSIVGSFPLLLRGSTTVRDGRGSMIAVWGLRAPW